MEFVTAIIASVIAALVGFYLGRLEKRPQIKVIAIPTDIGGKNQVYVEVIKERTRPERHDSEEMYPGVWVEVISPFKVGMCSACSNPYYGANDGR